MGGNLESETMNPKASLKTLAAAATIASCIALPAHAAFYLQSIAGCGQLASYTSEWPWTASFALLTISDQNASTPGPESNYYAFSQGAPSMQITPVSSAARPYSGTQQWIVLGYHYGSDIHSGYLYTFVSWANSQLSCYGGPIVVGGGLASRPARLQTSGSAVAPLARLEMADADKEVWRTRLSQRDSLGNEDVAVERIEPVFAGVQKAIDETNQNPTWRRRAPAEGLSFTPLNASASRLGSAKLVAERVAVGKSPQGWAGQTRLFSLGSGQWAILDEVDLLAAGASVKIIAEAINSDVNGAPASMHTERAPDGRQVATISWIAGNRSIRLTVGTKDSDARASLIEIARLLY